MKNLLDLCFCDSIFCEKTHCEFGYPYEKLRHQYFESRELEGIRERAQISYNLSKEYREQMEIIDNKLMTENF